MASLTIPQNPLRSEDGGQAQPPGSIQKKKRAIGFLTRFFFGDDVFISYSRRDAANYALKLANELTKRNLSCYVDQWGTPPGSKLPEKLKTALRRGTMLILIGSKGATDSEAVKQEVEEFLKTGRTIIPISFEGSLEAAEWFPLIRGLAIAQELESARQAGLPTEEVVSRIVNAKGFTRRNARLRRVFFGTVLSVILVLLSGGYIAREIVQQARASVKEAEGKVVVANAKVEEAEGKVIAANNQVVEAEGKVTAAEAKASEAEGKATDAKTREDAAKEQERIARDNAEKQQRIALSRQLAGRSSSSVGSRHDAALLLGAEAEKVSDTLEARRALLEALHHHPNLSRIFRGHTTQIYQVAFAPGGKAIAASTADDSVTVWDIESGAVFKLDRQGADFGSARFAFSPDGKKLAVSGSDGRIRLWDVATREMVSETQQVNNLSFAVSLAFTEDKRIISGGSQGSMLVWDASGDRLKLIDKIPIGPGDYIYSLALSPDRKMLSAVGREQVYLFDPRNNKQVEPPLGGFKDHVVGTTFSRDGRLLASVEQRGGVTLWDVAGHKQLTVEGDLLATATGVTFSPADDSLITTKADGTITRWSYTVIRNPGDQSQSLRVEKQNSRDLTVYKARAHSLAVDPYGKLLASGNADGTVTLWDLKGSNHLYQKADEAGGAIHIAYSSDGKKVVTVDKDHNLLLWEEGKGSRILYSNKDIGGYVLSIALSSRARILAIARNLMPALVFDIESNVRLGEIGYAKKPVSEIDRMYGEQRIVVPGPFISYLAISPNEKLLVSGTRDGEVSFWQIPSLARVGRPLSGQGEFIKFSPDGRFLATSHYDGPISLWDLANQGPASEPKKIPRGDSAIQEMAFSADGKTLFFFAKTDEMTGQLGALDLKTATPRLTVMGTFSFQEGAVAAKVAFSRDGKTLAYCDPRSFLYLWDIPTRSPLGQLVPDVTGLDIFTFTPDSKKLVVGGDEGLLIWDLNVNHWINLACDITKANLRVGQGQQAFGGSGAPVCPKAQ